MEVLGDPDRPNSATKHSRHHPHYWCLLGLALRLRRFDLGKARRVSRDFGLPLKSVAFFLGTLPKTNSSPLQMDGWNTTFLLGRPIFRGELLVSGRVGFPLKSKEPKGVHVKNPWV